MIEATDPNKNFMIINLDYGVVEGFRVGNNWGRVLKEGLFYFVWGQDDKNLKLHMAKMDGYLGLEWIQPINLKNNYYQQEDLEFIAIDDLKLIKNFTEASGVGKVPELSWTGFEGIPATVQGVDFQFTSIFLSFTNRRTFSFNTTFTTADDRVNVTETVLKPLNQNLTSLENVTIDISNTCLLYTSPQNPKTPKPQNLRIKL